MANTHKLYLHLFFDRPVGPGAVLVDARIETDQNPTIYANAAGRYHATLLHAEHGNPYHYEPGDKRLEDAEAAILRRVDDEHPGLLACPSLAALVRSRREQAARGRQPLVGQIRGPRLAGGTFVPDPHNSLVPSPKGPDDDGNLSPAYGKPPGVP